jgi:hypothetical protein
MGQQQLTRQQTCARQGAQPKRLDIFFHALKTFRLIVALLRDSKVHFIRKAAFIIFTGILLILLLLPDIPVALSVVLPVVGTLLGVPLDAGVDWVVFSLLVVSLLRIFPSEIVSEHYMHIFKN